MIDVVSFILKVNIVLMLQDYEYRKHVYYQEHQDCC